MDVEFRGLLIARPAVISAANFGLECNSRGVVQDDLCGNNLHSHASK